MIAILEPKIKIMKIKDIEAIAKIDKDNYQFSWSAGIFRDCLLAGYHNQIIEINKSIIGFSIMSLSIDGGHILNLCIKKKYRGYGYGKRLVISMISFAKKNNRNKIMLETRISNVAAISLYKKIGFLSVGIRPKYYRGEVNKEDALLLEKNI
tara:strand:- start:20164 stop:20619 length:456 start_codon:yes stop_codon:yes gene_type:complete